MKDSTKILGFRGEISDVNELIQTEIPKIPEMAKMAKGCLNYLERTPDPSRNYECKFSIGPLNIPYHIPTNVSNEYGYDPVSLGDTDLRMDVVYPYMREIAGISEKGDGELGVRARAESYKNEKGLCETNPAAFTGCPIDGKWISFWGAAHNVLFYCDEFERTGERKWLEEAFSIMSLIISFASSKDNMLYMPYGIAPWKDGEWLQIGWMEIHQKNYPFILEPLVRLYEISKEPSILEAAYYFAEGTLNGAQTNQRNSAINPETGEFEEHVHIHTRMIWGMAHFGVVTGDVRYTLWAKRAYDFVISKGTDYGWYPEHYPQLSLKSETCVIGDMVVIAYWLAKAGFHEEYDRMERTYRNYLRTAQFYITADFVSLFKSLHKECTEQEIEKALEQLKELEGGFVAQLAFNDLVTDVENIGQSGLRSGVQMMGCCPPSGMLGLYYIWKGIIQKVEDNVYINMSLNAKTQYADICVDYASENRLEIKSYTSGDFFIKLPSWANKTVARIYLNKQEIPKHWSGPGVCYLEVEGVKAGDVISLYYPLISFKQTFIPCSLPTNTEPITVSWIGNSVVSVEPKGEFLPVY